jgi:hypothetical protein
MTPRRISAGSGTSRAASIAACAALLLSTLTGLIAPAPAFADSTFSITGRGYGHSIGMSQWGAKGFAENGYTYDRIIKHYFQGTTIAPGATRTVRVSADKSKGVRSSWTLRAGNIGSRLVVNGMTAPADSTYRFTNLSGKVRVTDTYSGAVWQDFTSPISIVEATADIAGGGRAEENSAFVHFSGTWVTAPFAPMSGGAFRYSSSAGAAVTLRFQGPSIAWVGSRSAGYGIAEVWLDSVKVATVDTYAATTAHQQVLWSADGLAAGDHTVTVKVLGTKNAASTGSTVIVDAFDVGGDAPPVSSTSSTPLV